MTRVTINSPVLPNKVSGQVAIFEIGGHRIKFILQETTSSLNHDDISINHDDICLTHYASGKVVIQSTAMLALHIRYNRKLSDCELAKIALRELIDCVGSDRVLSVIDAAPVINGSSL